MSEVKLVVLDSGQTLPVVLTDYMCAARSERPGVITAYDLGVAIDRTELREGRWQELSGRVRTTCPICGRVHEALRQYCEFEFSSSTCPKCKGPWRATVTRLEREGAAPSFEEVGFTFAAQLSCSRCSSSGRSVARRIAGALSTIRRVKISPAGIEIERTSTQKANDHTA